MLFLHGYGSDGEDLLGLAPALNSLLPEKLTNEIAYFSPNGPEKTSFGQGYQWFSDKNFTFRDKPGITKAQKRIEDYIDKEIIKALSISAKNIVIVSFSQGTMTSLFAAPRMTHNIAGIVAYSGRLMWEKDLVNISYHKMPILLIHGANDDVVPADESVKSYEKLKTLGFETELHILPNLGHGIDAKGLTLAMEFINARFSE